MGFGVFDTLNQRPVSTAITRNLRRMRSMANLTLWSRQVLETQKPRSPDQGFEKMGASRLERPTSRMQIEFRSSSTVRTRGTQTTGNFIARLVEATYS